MHTFLNIITAVAVAVNLIAPMIVLADEFTWEGIGDFFAKFTKRN